MAKQVVGLFETLALAQRVVRDLRDVGFTRSEMAIRDAGASRAEWEQVTTALMDAGMPDQDLREYKDGLRSGGIVVMVQTSEVTAPVAYEIMLRYVQEAEGPAFEREVGGALRSQPDLAMEQPRTMAAQSPAELRRLDAGDEAVLPVVAEELAVGKREVTTGRVQVDSRVTERPVEADVRLREERISVERRPTNRPVSSGDQVGQDRSIEVHAMGEESVVAKQARVVEEVMINKQVQERTETVRDTVRRMDVDIEPAKPE